MCLLRHPVCWILFSLLGWGSEVLKGLQLLLLRTNQRQGCKPPRLQQADVGL